jgi:hypothetical protein
LHCITSDAGGAPYAFQPDAQTPFSGEQWAHHDFLIGALVRRDAAKKQFRMQSGILKREPESDCQGSSS